MFSIKGPILWDSIQDNESLFQKLSWRDMLRNLQDLWITTFIINQRNYATV